MISGMTEAEMFAALFRIVVIPVLSYIAWQIWVKYPKMLDDLKERQSKSEQSHAVVLVMVENIKEDIKEIKHGIEKMLDRRQHPRNRDE